MRDDANTSPPTNKQNPSCFASFREHYTSPSPAVSIKFVREVITVASLRAQLDYQVSGTKPSSLNVEFLVQDCLIPSENDWCKAYVLQVQPEGLVDVRVLSGDGAGNIVKGVSVKRLRGRRRVTAAIKFFYATAMIALFMTFLLLIPLVAFPRFCPLMNSRQTSLTSALSPSVCNSSTNFSIRGSHLRRLPLECCAPTVEGNRAFNNWLSSSEKDVTKELKNPMCRLDPDILFRHVFFCAGGSYAGLANLLLSSNAHLSVHIAFIFMRFMVLVRGRCSKVSLGVFSHSLASNLGSTIETPRPTIEGWVLFSLGNVVLVTFWTLAATAIPATWPNWALLIWFEFFWGQALLLLPFFWSFWQRKAMGGGHLLGLCFRACSLRSGLGLHCQMTCKSTRLFVILEC